MRTVQKKPPVREKIGGNEERTGVSVGDWLVGVALWGGGGRRAGRRSCGITPISVIRSSAVAGRGGEMAIQSPLAGSPDSSRPVSTPEHQTVGIRGSGKLVQKSSSEK